MVLPDDASATGGKEGLLIEKRSLRKEGKKARCSRSMGRREGGGKGRATSREEGRRGPNNSQKMTNKKGSRSSVLRGRKGEKGESSLTHLPAGKGRAAGFLGKKRDFSKSRMKATEGGETKGRITIISRKKKEGRRDLDDP